jgi:two-component system CheB/CheR fusion protein
MHGEEDVDAVGDSGADEAAGSSETEISLDETSVHELLDVVHAARGVDLRAYKPASLHRRIHRRISELRIDDLAQYVEKVRSDDGELNCLLDAIFINVTSFFRDAATWRHLREHTVPQLLAGLEADQPLRIWSAGCASGEEAYSLAMVLHEALGSVAFGQRVKIYATDIDAEALTTARRATYPAKQLDEVPDELVMRYLEPIGDRFVVDAALRRAVVFGQHDLIADPPISRIDVLMCRNTLMYFTIEAQTAVLDRFHFALNPRGILVLGRSEALINRSSKFAPLALPYRIYTPVVTEGRRRAPRRGVGFARTLQDSATVARQDPGFDVSVTPQILVDGQGLLAAANGQARRLFGLDADDIGCPLQDLEVSYRPLELRSRIEEVQSRGRAVTVRGVEWPLGDHHRILDVHVAPLHIADAATGTAGISVSFVDVTQEQMQRDEVVRLQAALDSAHSLLQSTIEELERTNEELQSTNEELETTNEELQSTNEELETINAELQSTNEELGTRNTEIDKRSSALDEANAALEAILTSLQSAVVVLTPELQISVWNTQAEELWGVRSEEVIGAALTELDIGLPVDQLEQPILEVLADHSARRDVELDAVNRRGRQVACRIRIAPLHRPDDPAASGVILLIDAVDGSSGPLASTV